jgi:[acyl-carrier-protein] S-malonyltransferase
MSDLALIFPGQGSQKPGMGRSLAENFSLARSVFDEVDDALSQKLSKLMFEGPADELTLTANAQPALMAVSVAAFRVLEEEAGLELSRVIGLAGHSLGEYSAHACAGTFDLATAARLLRVRGDAMQSAMPVGEGAMAAILSLPIEKVEEIAKAHGVEIANDNCPGQVVISGAAEAIDRACAIAKDAGAKRALKLDVSAAFHSQGMMPAQERMAEALGDASIASPAKPIVANVDGSLVTDPDEVRRTLTEQVSGRVRWQDCCEKLREKGAETFVELGAGKVLSGLVKKILPETRTISAGVAGDFTPLAEIVSAKD